MDVHVFLMLKKSDKAEKIDKNRVGEIEQLLPITGCRLKIGEFYAVGNF